MNDTRAQARRSLLHKTRHHHTTLYQQQGKKEDGIMKLQRGRNFQGGNNCKLRGQQCKLRGLKKALNNMKAGEAESQVRKSQRVINRGFISRFYEADGGLEVIKETYGNGILHVEKKHDDNEEDNDYVNVDDDISNDSDGKCTYNNYRHDGDWMPKSYKRNRIPCDYNGSDHDAEISCACVHDDHTPNADVDTHCHLGDHTPSADVDNGYYWTHNYNDYDATLSHSYNDNVHDDYQQKPINYDVTPPSVLSYIRRKRSWPRHGSKCRMKGDFPSWIHKKPRVFRQRRDNMGHGITNTSANRHQNQRQDAHADCESNTAVQHINQHMHIPQTWECYGSQTSHSMEVSQMHEDSQGPAITSIPLRPSSPVVSLSTVLEGLELADSEPTRSPHEVHSTHATMASHMTHGTKRPSPQQTKEVGEENCVQKEKSEAPMEPTQKPKRKKHRPKVQRDVFQKARHMMKNTMKKTAEKDGDGLQNQKQKNITKKPRAKKGHFEGECTVKPYKKKHSRMQRSVLYADNCDTLKDENLDSNSLCSSNRENSIIPVQSTILQNISNQFKENDCLQNLTVNEVAYLSDMLVPLSSGEQACKDELTLCTRMAEGQLRLNIELIECMRGNKLPLYGQFLGQQLQLFINENKLVQPFETIKEATMGSNASSLVQYLKPEGSNASSSLVQCLKPEGSTHLLLAQEPHNQLEMVVYDQQREMVASKSTKMRSKIRAKVQLDFENERIWPLLVLGSIPNDCQDTLYWEKERALMKRRVEVFIHKMQSVQGDRQFSPWKGSILDSVVGAFLTQNVSDHLSSSAFMSVASHFPSKHKDGTESTCKSPTNGTPNTENEHALETSGISCEVVSGTRDINKTSSGIVDEESSKQQGNFDLLDLEEHGSTNLTCQITTECAKLLNHKWPLSSLRAVKTVLRDIGANRPIETRDIESKSKANTSVITATDKGNVPTDKDYTRQHGIQERERASPHLIEEDIPTEQSRISISRLSDHKSAPVNYTLQSDMPHLESALPHFLEEKTPMKQCDIHISSLHHHTSITESSGQNCMKPLQRASPCLLAEGDISINPSNICISSISHHNGITVDYTGQSGMQNPERVPPRLIQENISMTPSDISTSSLGHHNGKAIDNAGQSGMQHLGRAAPPLMEEYISTSIVEEKISMKPSNISDSSLGHHNSITVDNTEQSGMQHLGRAAPPLMEEYISRIPCAVSMSHHGHENSIEVNHTGKTGMQRPSACLMEEELSRKPKDVSIYSLGHHNGMMVDYTGQSGMQHLKKASPSVMEEEISMKQSNHSSNSSFSYHKSMTAKYDLYDINDYCTERFNEEENCSSLSNIEPSCKNQSVSSPSETREFVEISNTNTALQDIRTSVDENQHSQSMDSEGWQGPGSRTNVYQNHTVCRRLFKDDIPKKMNSMATTPLNSHIEGQALNNSNATHRTEVHLTVTQESNCGSGTVQSAVAPSPALDIVGNERHHSLSGIVIQESKQVDCGSDVFHSAVVPSPDLKFVNNKKRHYLSGIERAHLEENQNGRKKNHTQDWESMRKRTLESCSSNESTCDENSREDAHHYDSVDWDAVRRASVEELAETIKERGMHHVLSGRIKAFLKTLHEEQGSLDLEWLRKVSPENVKAYLMGIRGLGVKSVECIRLLTLHHVAFPVDVNVGRICVRLGWVPIEPLPEQLQLHLLELYPIQETIQKYLWPRLYTLDQKTLYELHYQLITFGKVFCTKSKPNCNACPMRTECKHFASAYASAKLLLTGPNDEPSKSLCSGKPVYALTSSSMDMEENAIVENAEQKFTGCPQISEIDCDTTDSISSCQPFYIEEPASPEETHELQIADIEDFPCIYGSLNDFTEDLLKAGKFSEPPYESRDRHKSCIKENNKKWDVRTHSTDAGVDASYECLTTKGSSSDNGKQNSDGVGGQCNADDSILVTPSCISYPSNHASATPSASTSCVSYPSNDSSCERFSSYESIVVQEEPEGSEDATNALVSLPEGAYIPAPKLKNIDRLRTIHYVYELPDTHSLLEQADVREKDDPSSYLLAIWSPGEAPNTQQEIDKVCQEEDLCKFSGASANETVSGTLLVPCRTAMRGRFPLNGTYFQVNEVFADHASSLRPFQVPRSHIWRLRRRFVYFGTSVSNIFRGLTSNEIKSCFLHGHVCVRGFDREKRAPRPLVCRLHFPISKQIQRNKKDETEAARTH